MGAAVKPPLKRRVARKPWVDVFYVEHRHDMRAINQPYIKPMSIQRMGPYSSYPAAQAAGEAMGCSDFSIEKRRVNPECRVLYVDVDVPLNEESRDYDQPDPDDDAPEFTLGSTASG